MSKRHPNMSEKYKKKQQVRKKRQLKLQVLREAQRRYKIVYSCPKIENSKMNRSKIVTLKKKIEQELAIVGVYQ
jgi:hypothetical protein